MWMQPGKMGCTSGSSASSSYFLHLDTVSFFFLLPPFLLILLCSFKPPLLSLRPSSLFPPPSYFLLTSLSSLILHQCSILFSSTSLKRGGWISVWKSPPLGETVLKAELYLDIKKIIQTIIGNDCKKIFLNPSAAL